MSYYIYTPVFAERKSRMWIFHSSDNNDNFSTVIAKVFENPCFPMRFSKHIFVKYVLSSSMIYWINLSLSALQNIWTLWNCRTLVLFVIYANENCRSVFLYMYLLVEQQNNFVFESIALLSSPLFIYFGLFVYSFI